MSKHNYLHNNRQNTHQDNNLSFRNDERGGMQRHLRTDSQADKVAVKMHYIKDFSPVIKSKTFALGTDTRGPAIVELKKLLNGVKGVFQKSLDTSSDQYDQKTIDAVKAFQKKNGLTDDGLAGCSTINALIVKNKEKSSAPESGHRQQNVSAAVNPKSFSRILLSQQGPLNLNARGPEVVELKKLLNSVDGLLKTKLDLSSDRYDRQTAAAVREFQKKYTISSDLKLYHNGAGIGVDSAAGRMTIAALLIKNSHDIPKEIASHLKASLKGSAQQSQGYVPGKSSFTGTAYPHQISRNDCGPTACATALGIIAGQDKEQLAARFRSMNPNTSMSWSDPAEYARSVGAHCIQMDRFNPQQIASYLKAGCTAVVSYKAGSKLTDHGHIIALHGVKGQGDNLQFENLDPNRYNIAKGYGTLSGGEIKRDSKQVWVFVPEKLMVQFRARQNLLASR